MSYSTVNLHIHTTASDGLYSPAQILDLSIDAGLQIISITDHDTIDGIADFNVAELPLKVIAGIEFSAEFDRHYHILGYFPNYHLPQIESACLKLKESRAVRARMLIEHLKDMGFAIDMTDIPEKNTEISSIGRPHIASALVKKGYAKSIDEVFKKIFSRIESTARFKYSPKEIIDMIHKNKGIAVIAHPVLLRFDTTQFKSFLKRQINLGIDGIEAFYPMHTAEEIYFYKGIAQEYGLLTTAGSDFHGFDSRNLLTDVALIRPYGIWTGF